MGNGAGPIRCSSVELSGTMVRVIGTKTESAVPRERIREMRLVYDTAARYPFVQFFVGFVLLAVGGIGVVVLALTSFRGSLPISAESGQVSLQLVPLALWSMLALGLWLLLGVFAASYQLEIRTDEGMKRIMLGKAADAPGIRQFTRRASWSFGYEIDASVLDRIETAP